MNIKKVAVIGAGVMGSGIAAHFANAGIAVYLLDIVAKESSNRNEIAENALKKMLKTLPSPFMHPKNVHRVIPGNIEDDLDKLDQVDWVIEAVIEDPTIKQALYQQLTQFCRSDTLISSNTSTLPLSVLTANQSVAFKRRFMITHFFNPPRYMRLLELIAPPEMDKELLKTITTFADLNLGKGCVLCNDTPGFIANRIGTFWLQTALLEAIKYDLTVEQCDAAMTLCGIPKTGVFGLMDLVGIDLMPHILDSFKHALASTDPLSIIAETPALLQNMIAKGLTGRKGKGGFYRLQPDNKQKIKQSINLQQGDYSLSEKFKIQDAPHQTKDIQAFLDSGEALNHYLWQVWSNTLSYTANLIPEIAKDIVAVDTAMRLGYNWRYGPFELIDYLGIDWFIDKLTAENRAVPAFLSDRQKSYRIKNTIPVFKDLSNNYHPIQRPEGVLLLNDIKLKNPPILENSVASLWDIGDDIVCFEFHSKMNTLSIDSMKLLQASIKKITQEYQGLVIYNEADNFSAGANLTLLTQAIPAQDWKTIRSIIQLGQNTYRALKYAPFPIVGAPSGLALGGGCEILLHCDAIQAHAELYTGLVEVSVGLIPGWGGCKELLRRWLENPNCPGGALPPITQSFETIGLAKVSKSAQEAKDLLFLAKTDGVSMNKDRLLADAKARVLSLSDDYQAPKQPIYTLPGQTAWAALDIAINKLYMTGKATAYDVEITRQLARILSGGDTDISQQLSEQNMLDLELEAILYLLQQPGTLARLEHMLKTGKPLRN